MINSRHGTSIIDKLPRGLKLICTKHGGRLRYHDGHYYCMDKYDGSYCAMISVRSSNKQQMVKSVD